MDRLAAGGIDFTDVTRALEDDGIEKFAKSFETLLGVIGSQAQGARRAGAAETLGGGPGVRGGGGRPAGRERRCPAAQADLGARSDGLEGRSQHAGDPRPPGLAHRGRGDGAAGHVAHGPLPPRCAPSSTAWCSAAWAARVSRPRCSGAPSAPRRGIRRSTCSTAPIPAPSARWSRAAISAKTLFIISSKSGTTLESDSFFSYFWHRTGGRGSQFVAITDPGHRRSRRSATTRRFRRTFLNPPDIGGRYSALSFFGLVPAALIGVDVAHAAAPRAPDGRGLRGLGARAREPRGVARRGAGRGRAGRAEQGDVRALARASGASVSGWSS